MLVCIQTSQHSVLFCGLVRTTQLRLVPKMLPSCVVQCDRSLCPMPYDAWSGLCLHWVCHKRLLICGLRYTTELRVLLELTACSRSCSLQKSNLLYVEPVINMWGPALRFRSYCGVSSHEAGYEALVLTVSYVRRSAQTLSWISHRGWVSGAGFDGGHVVSANPHDGRFQ